MADVQALGDFATGQTVTCRFVTSDDTDAPITLGGTPAARVRKGTGSGSVITAGVTLAVDVVTGQHCVDVDLSASGSYAAGFDYYIELSAGTVNGISMVGKVLGRFSIQNRSDPTGVTTLLGRLTSTRAAYLDKLNNLPEGIKKNTALNNFTFFMVDSSDHVSGKTGLTVTATRRLDGGSFAACANAPTELVGGYYSIDFAAADLNGEMVCVRFTATGADEAGFEAKLSA